MAGAINFLHSLLEYVEQTYHATLKLSFDVRYTDVLVKQVI